MIKALSKIPFIQIPIRWALATINAFIYPVFIRKRFKHLNSLKDKHKGQRCFIVATGPSLLISDLEMLKGEVCFSCNSVAKIFDKTSWRPEYYFMFDKDVFVRVDDDLKRNVNEIQNFFHPYDWPYDQINSRPYVLKRDSWYTEKEKDLLRNLKLSRKKFSKDIHSKLYRGGSVVHVMMQFASYMGFSEIYLLGCDCNYGGGTTHAEGMGYNLKIKSSNERIMDDLMEDYQLAKDEMYKQNVTIFNATRGGKLELFERVKLEEVVKPSIEHS